MGEMRRAVPHGDLRRHADALERVGLERHDIESVLAAARQVQRHVDDGRGGVFDGGEALVEGPRRQEALQQLLRHRLAGAVMPGMGAQDLRLFEPVLIELRGQFHEIAGHRRARERSG